VNFTYDPATGRKTGEEFIFTFGGTSTAYAYELGSGNLTSMTRSSGGDERAPVSADRLGYHESS
jgi:hypothetical protein